MQGEAFLHASRLERPSLDTTLPSSTGDAAAYGHPGVQVEPAETAKKARPTRLVGKRAYCMKTRRER